MALSSYSAMNWAVVPDQYHGIIGSPPAAVEAPPQLLTTTTTLPSYSNFNSIASFAYNMPNNKRLNEAVKADPSFFNKACYEHNISLDAELADDYCYAPYVSYCNQYDTYTCDDVLDPAAANFFSPATDLPSLESCYEINDLHLQQQLWPELEFLGFDDNYGVIMNHDPFYHCQAPPQTSKRQKTSYFDYPPVQLPGLHNNRVLYELTDVEQEEGLDQTMPRPRRVSAQRVAARERRKKISDKTQELGKLIPGGSKMNTAEMLQSAFNYVKFLQSQVHVLQLMSSLNPTQESDRVEDGKREVDAEELQPTLLRMVASTAVQEKLYKEASCIIPRSLAETLKQHHPHLHDLHQLL